MGVAAAIGAIAVVAVALAWPSGSPEAQVWAWPSGTPGTLKSASPSPSGSPSSSPSPAPSAGFTSSVEPLTDALMARMTGASWHAGCPLPMTSLRLVHLTYFGFDGLPHEGALIVNAAVTDNIIRIFQKVYAARFPIRKMVPIDAYGGSDDRSMADDNTSMFNCRTAYGSKNWSVHAFGRAVDINTIENPYLPGVPAADTIVPPEGKPFADRHSVRPGMLVYGDPVVRAFLAEGFRWGGSWTRGPDYQHFEI